MTDRELLEAAANAAGMHVFKEGERWGDDACGWFFNQVGDNPPALYSTEQPASWRPLTDDGDALRLAVKLNLRVDAYDHQVECMDGCEPYKWGRETFTNTLVKIQPTDNGEDRMAACRRAIVRAAAALHDGGNPR